MVQKIRYHVVHFLINRELRNTRRIRQASGLNDCREVGLLFLLGNEAVYRRVNSLIYRFTEEGKEVHALGIYHDRVVPNYYLARLKVDLITKDKLSFLSIPKRTDAVNSFLARPFDMLIDLTLNTDLATAYLAAFSRARFKIGPYHEDMVKVYDFMMKMPGSSSFNDYVDTLTTYLSSLNTTKS